MEINEKGDSERIVINSTLKCLFLESEIERIYLFFISPLCFRCRDLIRETYSESKESDGKLISCDGISMCADGLSFVDLKS